MENSWKKSVVYQIYPKSFYDSDGDGMGDINGITEKLSYISDLGCDVIWLCPVCKSPMKDNGYDVSDYYSIDKTFGSNEDFYNLIDKAKEKGIKIIMDLVVNHCSNEHEWFKEFLKNPDGKYKDYFIVREKTNNWRSIFGGSVWEKIEGTNLYYYHTFAKEQPDLNWECRELREEVYKIIDFWKGKGIAGFRIDAITHIKKNQAFPDAETDGNDNLASPKENAINCKGIEVFLNELKSKFKGLLTVAEAPGVPYEDLKEYIGDGGYFSMIFDFSYADLDVESHGSWYPVKNFTPKDFKDAVFETQENLQKCGFGANYLENHDQPRSLNKYLNEINYHSATMLGAFYFFLRGVPFIYQGQELGAVNGEWESLSEFDDLQTKDQYKRALSLGLSEKEALDVIKKRSRDNSRMPVLWDENIKGGWLKVTKNYTPADNNKILEFYKKMIALRKREDTLIYGDFKKVNTEDEIFCYERSFENKKITVICNYSDKEKNTDLSFNEVLLTNYDSFDKILKPWQVAVVT